MPKTKGYREGHSRISLARLVSTTRRRRRPHSTPSAANHTGPCGGANLSISRATRPRQWSNSGILIKEKYPCSPLLSKKTDPYSFESSLVYIDSLPDSSSLLRPNIHEMSAVSNCRSNALQLPEITTPQCDRFIQDVTLHSGHAYPNPMQNGDSQVPVGDTNFRTQSQHTKWPFRHAIALSALPEG